MSQTTINGASSERSRLLKVVDALPMPDIAEFRTVPAPSSSELSSYRLVEDRKVRLQLATAFLIEIIQSPGPGNWKKKKPPPYIAKVHPNFDAPASARRTRAGRPQRQLSSDGSALSSRLPLPVVHDLREKWEAYYVDSRPENQRRHAQRAQSIEPNAISARANQILADARRKGRNQDVREAIFAATEELTADFETAMRRKYGDLLVDVLGIPDATDTRERA